MIELPLSIINTMDSVSSKLEDRPKIKEMFRKCFLNTLETTTKVLNDGTTFIFTGDISAMWLRDSTAQVLQYINCDWDDELEKLIEGLIKRQIMYILIDPYANAFNMEPNNKGHKDDITEHNLWVWERKYEIDSLCYPIKLSYIYWKKTGTSSIFDDKYKKALETIIYLWKMEQRHHMHSQYYFERYNCPPTDTLRNGKKGMPVNYTGMTWSGFRPSDDACTFGFNVPSNMFAVVVLRYMEEIIRDIYKDEELRHDAIDLREEIEYGINTYGIYTHSEYGKIYAYETDGYGNYNLMDDANVPSLLSIPYIGYVGVDNQIYKNTRKFILSKNNPYYFEGKHAKGIGSPHTPNGYIWHISLIMQALTSDSDDEIEDILQVLEKTDAGTGFMHEGFNSDNPNEYTRPWFAWANSLFGELIMKIYK